MYKRKILIDLDGVLNEYNGSFDEKIIPKAKMGVNDFLEKLSLHADLYLFTSRNLISATKWLIKNDLEKYFKDVTNIKIPSYLYIDDRCISFNGNFDETLSLVENFKPYWNKNIL